MILKLTLPVLLGAFCGASLYAATIAEVRFEQTGGATFPEEQLRYNVQAQKGQEYDPVVVNEDLKRIFNTGFFDDPTVRTERLPSGDLILTYVVKARPTVSMVTFEGNKKISDREITEQIALKADMPLNGAKIDESLRNLRKFYTEEGYHEATIIPEIRTEEDGQVVVNFKIDEKLRYRVDHVTFEGATAYSAGEMKSVLANRYNFLSWLMSVGLLSREELENDKIRLRDLFWNKGYLDFKVDDVTVTEQPDDPVYVDIHFKLFEGEPYHVGTVSIEGNEAIPTEELEELVRLKPEQVFDYQKEEATRSAIVEAYNHLGYADVNVRATRNADYDTHVVDVKFEVTDGRIYHVRKVMISGNEMTKDKVIRREMAIHDDDPLDPTMIEVSKQRLLGMGYFNKVEAYATNTDAVDAKDVHFEVEEKDAYVFGIGAEFSDVNSLAGMVSITNNNFDLFNPENYFIGGGQRLRLAGVLGFHGGGADINFTEPWLFDIPMRLDVNGFWNEAYLPDWREERLGVSTALSKKIFDDFTSWTVGYKFEHVRVSHMDLASLRDQTGGSYVSEWSLILNRDTRDNLLNPTEGYQISAMGAISPKIMGSSENFYRLEGKGVYYNNFLDKAIIWFLAGKVGVVSGFNRDDEMPVYERYFMGGGDSIRGFPWRSVSPLDDKGHAIGGQTMFLVTAEITHPIWRFIRGAVFSDIGNSYSNAYSFGPSGINMGVGYGLRIMVPYLEMPVKLDLAYPVVYNQSSEDRSLRFHFNLGYSWNGW